MWNCLRQLKKTATAPDDILFWVWKDHAEIFTPIICMIWNLSLKFSTWPSSWKRADATPLPEVDVPKERQTTEGSTILRSLRAHLRSGCIKSTHRTLLRNTWAWLSSPTGKGELYRCTPKCAVKRVSRMANLTALSARPCDYLPRTSVKRLTTLITNFCPLSLAGIIKSIRNQLVILNGQTTEIRICPSCK